MRKHYLFTAVLLLALVLSPIASASSPVGANSGVSVQLAMILDGSGSIGSDNWDIIKEGLASAIENPSCVPHDGSVELTVVQFGYSSLQGYAKVELSPTVIDSDAAASAAGTTIRAMPYAGWSTPMAHGIKLAADTLWGSTNFDPSLKQALNLVTDGNPNVCHPDWTCLPYKDNVVSARDYAISLLGMDTDPQDEFDAEAIGTEPDVNWLRDSIVWPQPGYVAPPFDQGPGWVRAIPDVTTFANTICEKFKVIIEPGTITAHKFNDLNGNGAQDGGEDDLEGWEMTLYEGAGCTGDLLESADTDVNGKVTFSGLTPGDYSVKETLQDCWQVTTPFGNPSICQDVSLSPGGSETVNFGNRTISYTLTVNSNGCCPIDVSVGGSSIGTVTAGGTEEFTLDCCTNVTLTADDSDVCCSFVNWTGDVPSGHESDNPLTIHMDSNKSLTANCEVLVGEICDYGAWEDDPANPCQERREILKCSAAGECTGSGEYEYHPVHVGEICDYGAWEDDPANPCQERREILKCSAAGECTGSGEYEYRPVVCDPCYECDPATGECVPDYPTADFTFDPPICEIYPGDTVTFTNQTTGGTGSYTYDWNFGDATAHSSAQNPTHEYAAGGDYPVTLTVTDESGCKDSIEKTVTVHEAAALCFIGDTVFYDNNGNGMQDFGEGGISGITLNLYLDDGDGVFDPGDTLVDSATTDASGYYEFTDLDCTATYWVDVVDSPLLSGLTLTAGNDPYGPISFEPEAEVQVLARDDADFGYQPAAPPPIGVGGEAYPVNKLAILAPWIVLFAGIPVCAIILTRRRAQS